MKLRNKLAVAPMSTYKAVEGIPNGFHTQHYGTLAFGGFGMVIVEATAVLPEGRIAINSTGLYDDAAIPQWRKVVDAIHDNGAAAVVQLVHAGNKCAVPNIQTYSVMGTKFSKDYSLPLMIDNDYLQKLRKSFVESAKRAQEAGFDAVELHAAHGYLLSEFVSVLTNHRDDKYGVDYAGRTRLIQEIANDIKDQVGIPVGIRVSAYEWEKVNTPLEDFVNLTKDLPELIYISVSSGGLTTTAKINPKDYYQLDLATAIKAKTKIPVMSAGGYDSALKIKHVFQQDIDFVAIGRSALIDPWIPLTCGLIQVKDLGPQNKVDKNSYYNKILLKRPVKN